MFGDNPTKVYKQRPGKRGRRGHERARSKRDDKANHARKYASKGEIVMRCRGRESGGVGLCVMGERGEDETVERGGRFGGFVLIRDKDGGDTLRFAGLGEVTLQSLLVGTC